MILCSESVVINFATTDIYAITNQSQITHLENTNSPWRISVHSYHHM